MQMSAKDFLDLLPLEVRYKILDKTPLPLVADLLREEDVERFDRRFEEACRDNYFPPLRDITLRWKDIFVRHLAALKNKRLYTDPGTTHLCEDDVRLNVQMTGRTLDFSVLPRHSVSQVSLTLTLPKYEKFPRKTNFLDKRYRTRGVTHFYHIELGNKHDIRQAKEEVDTFHGKIWKNEHMHYIAFDDLDRVYFIRASPPFNIFYRKDLTSRDEPETLFKLSDRYSILWFAVSESYKVFVFAYESDAVIIVNDLQTGLVCSTLSACICSGATSNAHGNSVVFTGEDMQTWLYTVEGSKFNKQKIPCYRRQQLNKDSYLIMVDTGEEKVVLK
uniref:F-box domain-containing protein n=2 Tax=Bursaphelenchus xylophilus TaxID=6326 RepID=A0A1I7SHS3_BURXY